MVDAGWDLRVEHGAPLGFFVKSGFAGVKSGLGLKSESLAGVRGLGIGVDFQLSAISCWLLAQCVGDLVLCVLSV